MSTLVEYRESLSTRDPSPSPSPSCSSFSLSTYLSACRSVAKLDNCTYLNTQVRIKLQAEKKFNQNFTERSS